MKLEGKREEDPQETEAEGSDSEEAESQGFEGSWQKLNYRTVVSGPSLQENLGKSGRFPVGFVTQMYPFVEDSESTKLCCV